MVFGDGEKRSTTRKLVSPAFNPTYLKRYARTLPHICAQSPIVAHIAAQSGALFQASRRCANIEVLCRGRPACRSMHDSLHQRILSPSCTGACAVCLIAIRENPLRTTLTRGADKQLSRCTMDIVFEAAFGHQLGAQRDAESERFTGAVGELLAATASPLVLLPFAEKLMARRYASARRVISEVCLASLCVFVCLHYVSDQASHYSRKFTVFACVSASAYIPYGVCNSPQAIYAAIRAMRRRIDAEKRTGTTAERPEGFFIRLLMNDRTHSSLSISPFLFLLFLFLFLSSAEAGYSDQAVHDELFNLFVAGHEATAITVTWALYLLTQHSNVRQRSVSGMLYVCVCVCLCMCM